MDATIYQMESFRSRLGQRSILTEIPYFPMQMASVGLGIFQAATSFWAAYAGGMLSCHHKLVQAAFSINSNAPSKTASPQHW